MNILHWKRTTIAEAPDEFSKCINKYTSHNSKVKKRGAINDSSLDVVHFHNMTTVIRSHNPKTFLQYHSEPHRVRLTNKVDDKFVVAQYHATLPEYSECSPIRNIIDFNKDLYKEKYFNDKIRVGFSPSVVTNNGFWFNKGYKQTERILKRLKKEYPSDFDYNIIRGKSLERCIELKSECNVIIDECVTPSYHRSGLEGLALGKYTICSIHPEIESVIRDVTSAENHPFVDVQITGLYSHLKNLIERGTDYVIERGRKSRKWMENNWSPSQICSDLVNRYEA